LQKYYLETLIGVVLNIYPGGGGSGNIHL